MTNKASIGAGRTIFTGDRPTGSLHLGHYVGSLHNRLNLQQNGDAVTILIADTQVLNNNVSKASNVKQNILSVMQDYIAIGLDPLKTRFVLQSRISEIFELTNYLSNVVPMNVLMRVPTLKSESRMYGMDAQNLGFISYPVAQTADIVLFEPDLVPVGEDQLPVLEFGNEVIRYFHNAFNCEVFSKIVPMISDVSRLVGIDGQEKMSKSLGNSIALNASTKDVEVCVRKMYTDSGHIKVSDPGKVEGNVVFQFLDVFHTDKEEVNDLKNQYRRGGLGDSYLKKLLVSDIEMLLEPMRENRLRFTDTQLMEFLDEGTRSAKEQAFNKMIEVRDIIFR